MTVRIIGATEALALLGGDAIYLDGFTRVLDFAGGWSGNATAAGWERSGGPISVEREPGRSHGELAK